MVHRSRPRVQLTGGGPTWPYREGKRTSNLGTPGLSKKQKKEARGLAAVMRQLDVSVRRRDVVAARSLRSQAWEIVDRLPAHSTWKHRRALGDYKLMIWALEAQQRRPRPPA